MTDQPTPEEIAEAKAESLNFHQEAVRAGLFATAIDMMENGVPDGAPALLEGALEFAVSLWDRTMTGAGVTPAASREALTRRMRHYLVKHRHQSAVDAREAGK